MIEQYKFHPTRNWRFDFAFPDVRIAVEIQGHKHHKEYQQMYNDCQKNNEAARYGWTTIFIMSKHLTKLDMAKTANMIRNLVEARAIKPVLCATLRSMNPPPVKNSSLPPGLEHLE